VDDVGLEGFVDEERFAPQEGYLLFPLYTFKMKWSPSFETFLHPPLGFFPPTWRKG